jgi:site-specific DNA recombinase
LSPAITVPWTFTASSAHKGLLHSPATRHAMSEENRDTLRLAIAKARVWIEDLAAGRVASFSEIAANEGRVERHIKQLAQLAFVSPRTIGAITERTMPNIKVTELAKATVASWTRQQQKLSV